MIIFGLSFTHHFLTLFLMGLLHPHQGIVELSLKFGTFLLKGGPHELALQLDLICQIVTVFIDQSLLVPHHSLQFTDLFLLLCFLFHKWL